MKTPKIVQLGPKQKILGDRHIGGSANIIGRFIGIGRPLLTFLLCRNSCSMNSVPE